MVKLILVITAVWVVLIDKAIAQDEVTTTANLPSSKIKGPLVTLHADSFVDTLMVLLQSEYHNNNTLKLDPRTETVTVAGVDLIVDYEGTVTVATDLIPNRTVSAGGNLIDITMMIPNLLINKTYAIRSVEDPDYVSKGTVILSVDGGQLYIAMNSRIIPYFVDSVRSIAQGTMNTEIHGQGLPLAEEIQEVLQNLVITEYTSFDGTTFRGDMYRKFDYIFKNNQLVLCATCDPVYCICH